MKKMIIGLLITGSISLGACNSGQSSHEDHDSTAAASDTAAAVAADDELITAITPQFATVDAKAAAGVKAMTDNYLQLKNALADDNDKAAAGWGKTMAATLKGIDKSPLTSEQKKIYEENEEDLKEHAEHIGKNEGNIKHQREHFAKMSEDVYALVKAFGGGQTLYHDHCPMYNDNKGALWLSEKKEISNPYFGKEMPRCGNVEEMIK